MSVTGPSLVKVTCISAPKTPVATSAPSRRKEETKASIRGSLIARGAAALHDGRRPLRVSAYSVNWLTTRIGAFSSWTRPLAAEDAECPHLLGQPLGSHGLILMGDSRQDQQTGPVNRTHDIAGDLDLR